MLTDVFACVMPVVHRVQHLVYARRVCAHASVALAFSCTGGAQILRAVPRAATAAGAEVFVMTSSTASVAPSKAKYGGTDCYGYYSTILYHALVCSSIFRFKSLHVLPESLHNMVTCCTILTLSLPLSLRAYCGLLCTVRALATLLCRMMYHNVLPTHSTVV